MTGPQPERRGLDARQADGHACAICGAETGSMVPAGTGPGGQLFAHPECVEDVERKPAA